MTESKKKLLECSS